MFRNQPKLQGVGAMAKSAVKTVFYEIMEEKDRNK
jgi:hypothetical protein